MVRHAVSTGSVRGIFGRYRPKSGPVMLALSFVEMDPTRTYHEFRSRPFQVVDLTCYAEASLRLTGRTLMGDATAQILFL